MKKKAAANNLPSQSSILNPQSYSPTLHEKLTFQAQQRPDHPVMQMQRDNIYERFTFRQLFTNALCLADELLKLNIKVDDKIAIILENCPEWAMIYFAIMYAGAIAIPIDPQTKAKDLTYLLTDSDTKLVFTSEATLTTVEQAIQSLAIKPTIILYNNLKQIFAKDINADEILAKLPKRTSDNLASIIYTSGTTGVPKGVMLSHGNFYANFKSSIPINFITKKDNMISILPLHHVFPFMANLIFPLFSCAMITYIPSLKSEIILQTMRDTGVTILTGVPHLFQMFYDKIYYGLKKITWYYRLPLFALINLFALLRKFTRINLNKLLLGKVHKQFGPKLKYFGSGGAKLNKDIASFLTKIGFTILEGYGLTETAPIVTFNRPGREKLGSAGEIIPDVEIKIDNPDAAGIGEIIIRGHNVMQGYYKHSELTDEVIKDGWFYSGDLGYLDKQGYLFITGRKKELIVLSSGKNIAPEEIEMRYGKSLFIKELCVLAPSENEDKLMAVIVPDLDHFRKVKAVNINGMIKWDLENLSRDLPPYKRIMGFIISQEELPRTRLGKLKRYVIYEQYQNQLLGKEQPKSSSEIPLSNEELQLISSTIGKQIIALIQESSHIENQIYPNNHLEIDLGFDSLKRIELMADIEHKLKIAIPDTVMASIFTVGELIKTVEEISTTTTHKTEKALNSWNEILNSNPSKEILQMVYFGNKNPYTRSWTFLLNKFVFIISKLYWRLEIHGKSNLPKNEAIILCPNHASYLDAFIIFCSLPINQALRLYFLGFRRFFETARMRKMAKAARVIPIDQGAQIIDAMQASAYILNHQRMLCLFPEGARSIDGNINEFKKGAGILAKELNIRLLPIYLDGAGHALPRASNLPRPHKIKIYFGKPCEVATLNARGLELGAKDDYEAIALAIREQVVLLQKECYERK